MNGLQSFTNPSGNFGTGRAVLLKTISHILLHRHVREKRITLKYHSDVSLIYRNRADSLAVEKHIPVFRTFKAGDHSQRRRLSAAGRTENRHQRTVFDFQVYMIHYCVLTVDLCQIL